MTHDPLCPWAHISGSPDPCDYCALVATVRADERERIAQDAEAFIAATYPADPRGDSQILPEDVSRYHKWVGAKTVAARIARNGGQL